jgi:hypothetical protein
MSGWYFTIFRQRTLGIGVYEMDRCNMVISDVAYNLMRIKIDVERLL